MAVEQHDVRDDGCEQADASHQAQAQVFISS